MSKNQEQESGAVYEVWHHDLDEGRDGHYRVALFESALDAQEVARRKEYCVQGCRENGQAMVECVPVFRSVGEFDAYQQETLRKQALKKLTVSERRALGLS